MLNTLAQFLKSIIDQDRYAIVICNLQHEILYMNPSAVKNYEKWGGRELIGKSVLLCHNPHSVKRIEEIINWFKESEEHNIIYTMHNERQNKDVYMVALRDENKKLIGYYERHEFRNPETMSLYDFTD